MSRIWLAASRHCSERARRAGIAKKVGMGEFVDEAPLLELQARVGGGNAAPACGGGLAVENLANFLLQIVALHGRDARVRTRRALCREPIAGQFRAISDLAEQAYQACHGQAILFKNLGH